MHIEWTCLSPFWFHSSYKWKRRTDTQLHSVHTQKKIKEKEEKGRPKCNIGYQTDTSEQVMHLPFTPAAGSLCTRVSGDKALKISTHYNKAVTHVWDVKTESKWQIVKWRTENKGLDTSGANAQPFISTCYYYNLQNFPETKLNSIKPSPQTTLQDINMHYYKR